MTIASEKEKQKALVTQLQFQKVVLQAVAPTKEHFQQGKSVSGKRIIFSVAQLTKHLTEVLACEAQTHFRSSLLSLRKIASANPSDKTISETSRRIVRDGYVFKSKLKGRRGLCIAVLFSQNDAFTKVNLPGLWD